MNEIFKSTRRSFIGVNSLEIEDSDRAEVKAKVMDMYKNGMIKRKRAIRKFMSEQ